MQEGYSESPLSTRCVDCILHNRRRWREALKQLEPGGRSAAVPIFVTGGRSDSRVERLAVKRAAVSQILDVVDRVLRRIPEDLRVIERLKYRDGYVHRRIAEHMSYSVPTVERRLRKLRELVGASLACLPGDSADSFWRDIDGYLM